MVKSVILTRDKKLFNNSSLNINEEGNIDVSGTITGGDISGNIVRLAEYNNLYNQVIAQQGFKEGDLSIRDLKTMLDIHRTRTTRTRA